ncbi:MAG: FTR1 family protein [Anaerolineales bacterium]|nr:FTR1 family protein [Anaerolineales bacterium]
MRRLIALFLAGIALTAPLRALAAAETPGQAAEFIRAALVRAQLQYAAGASTVAPLITEAEARYRAVLAQPIAAADPAAAARAEAGLSRLQAAPTAAEFAAARAQVWTAILAGGYAVVEQAVLRGDAATAREWLGVREFRQATRFSRPDADATLAIERLGRNAVTPAETVTTLRADLFDTYQARLNEALSNLAAAQSRGFVTRSAEHAALAQGYFEILAPAYAEQRTLSRLDGARESFTRLVEASLGAGDLQAALVEVQAALKGFRAAPLTPQEQVRRANQLLRYLALVPIEYGRGVANGHVTRELEIQEAVTFRDGAAAAFADLQTLLEARDPEQTALAAQLLNELDVQLEASLARTRVASAEEIRAKSEGLSTLLTKMMPDEWLTASTSGDFDVIRSMLDQMEKAARAGQYDLAESARLEAYALLEIGPEAKLIVFAPELKLRLEELFWNGRGEHKGLAYLLRERAPFSQIRASRAALDAALAEAQAAIGASSAPAAVAANAGVIVFREGLEAVLILASLMSSMKRPEERRYRRPMWLGAGLALLATAATWLLARGVLQSLARYGEKLEAVVSLIAIGVLLLILNWFFHKTYWTDWIAAFHARKRRLISGETGLWLGLVTLGFTSMYREGFETVLFLQALVLEGGTAVVLIGAAVALAAVVGVGVITFRLQVRLPYKDMLIVTGVLIGVVLLQMVGNTVHLLQVVGWLPIHLIEGVRLPFWLGTWFGLYATWEGVGLQAAAAAFVIGSYYLAEHLQKRRTPHVAGRATVRSSG